MGRVYVAGSGRYVARRVDRNRWESLEKGIIVPTGDERIFSAGFRRIDGFSESDIYRNDYEAKYDCSADIPVPREFFFDSEFQYSEDTAKPVLNAFLQSLDYDNNPWLCTPEEMLEKGFQGTPYKVG